MSRIRTLVFLAIFCSTPAAAQAVWTVHGPAPGGIGNIQNTVDAASDGDLILIAGGSYFGFTIDDKELTVAALHPMDLLNPPVVGFSPIQIENLARGKTVLIKGVHTAGLFDNGTHLVLQGNAGSVWVEGCRFRAGCCGPSLVKESDSFVAVDCTVFAAPTVDNAQGYAAFSIEDSNAALFNFDATGGLGDSGFGFANSGGGPGLIAERSFVFAEGSTFTGGKAATTSIFGICWPTSDGGDALVIDDLTSRLVLTNCIFNPGLGSTPYTSQSTMEACPGGATGLDVRGRAGIFELASKRVPELSASFVDESGMLALLLVGNEGEVPVVRVSKNPGGLFLPDHLGDGGMTSPTMEFLVQPLPFSGQAVHAVFVPDVSLGEALYVQAQFHSESNTRTSTPRAVIKHP